MSASASPQSRSLTISSSEANRSAFGTAFLEALETRSLNQTQAAESLGVSASYLNQTITGRKNVSASWADMVADVMRFSADERVKLHRAAASDQGFKLDLTKR